jgi:hypothetical protein
MLFGFKSDLRMRRRVYLPSSANYSIEYPKRLFLATDHTHNFKAHCGVSRLHHLKVSGWAEDSFNATMVCLDYVVQTFRGAVLGGAARFTFTLQPMDGFGI